ncbi:hypothetical protein F4V89_22080 [Neorhizobium galegae]|nr:hypothetical protein [Neorhizobium galegae]KAB1111111.1 hypothetical protein F4V89_22080 [Neorhizobium galegae]MCQ1772227.1 hypothetical protein [Neorhizobium galegae]CDZ30507.1 Hypothetical protein NGAL_HAMBI490_53760 [Neorhizobium galegae bv. officinalis]
MTAISSVNSTALLILRQPVAAASVQAGSSETGAAESDILKIANGVSSEPAKASRQAAAAAGKLAVDSAPADGKIVVAGLGSADTWGEIEERVKADDSLSESQQQAWLGKLEKLQEIFASVKKFKGSASYEMARSGAHQSQLAELGAGARDRMEATHQAIDAFAEKHGRGRPFQEF